MAKPPLSDPSAPDTARQSPPPGLPPGPVGGQAFVLLDDARADGGRHVARLYLNPLRIIVARAADAVEAALAEAEAALDDGLCLAGHIAYEAGLALEPRLVALADRRVGADGPLVWLAVFESWHDMAADDVPLWLAAHADTTRLSRIGPMVPQISPGTYVQGFDALAQAIRDGDIYQANYTLPLAGRWRGDPLAIYASLRQSGGGGHGGIVHDGARWLLSLSPELFVRVDGDSVTVRPMKGTRPRGGSPAQDAALAAELVASVKDRAENLMIVDLMRNDLSRVSVAGSVRVAAPFAVETYPTVHQMVTTVRARLAPGRRAVDVVRALFPCGSITGAPKIRAMELINQHEATPRGAYCGAIGYFDPPLLIAPAGPTSTGPTSSGGARFNVAIRTLVLSPGEAGVGLARLGVGSAIVADSRGLDEWRECLVKGGFVHQPAPEQHVAQFDLIETMGFAPDTGVPMLELHLERIKRSAAALGFSFDRHAVKNAIQALCFEAEAPAKLRLVVARSGTLALEIAPVPAPIAEAACVVLPIPLDPSDWRLAHKTSDRGFYDAGLAAARGVGAHEALFIREDGLLTEGCFTNLFVARDGVLVTPPAALGLLPGILRRRLLDEGRAIEGDIRLDDLAQGFFIGNALRGLTRARLLEHHD